MIFHVKMRIWYKKQERPDIFAVAKFAAQGDAEHYANYRVNEIAELKPSDFRHIEFEILKRGRLIRTIGQFRHIRQNKEGEAMRPDQYRQMQAQQAMDAHIQRAMDLIRQLSNHVENQGPVDDWARVGDMAQLVQDLEELNGRLHR